MISFILFRMFINIQTRTALISFLSSCVCHFIKTFTSIQTKTPCSTKKTRKTVTVSCRKTVLCKRNISQRRLFAVWHLCLDITTWPQIFWILFSVFCSGLLALFRNLQTHFAFGTVQIRDQNDRSYNSRNLIPVSSDSKNSLLLPSGISVTPPLDVNIPERPLQVEGFKFGAAPAAMQRTSTPGGVGDHVLRVIFDLRADVCERGSILTTNSTIKFAFYAVINLVRV